MTRTIDGVELTSDQAQDWRALFEDLGDELLADEVFALAHAHDGTRWVPLAGLSGAENTPFGAFDGLFKPTQSK